MLELIGLKDDKPDVGESVLCLSPSQDYFVGTLELIGTDLLFTEDREGMTVSDVTHWAKLPPKPKD